MKITRREFMKGSLTAGAFLAAGGAGALFSPRKAHAFSQSPNLLKFIQALRNPVTGGIPLAGSDGVRTWTLNNITTTATHYTIDINQFNDLLHPNLVNPTRLWGYNPAGTAVQKHLGGIIVAQKGTPVQVTFRNNLPAQHILPVDITIPGAAAAQNRTATHLHGGLVPWISDGGPFDWWAPDGTHGDSFLNNSVLNPTAALNEAEYYYPNNQTARLVWYHDHAFGITRLNAYAGIASAYVITDDYEATLVSPVTTLKTFGSLPGPLDSRTLYLVFQDKIFYTGTNDPAYAGLVQPSAASGDLWYAHVYDPLRWLIGPAGTPPATSVIPEFFGDTILVNGSVYPFVNVEPRQYRLRMLNACNARFLTPRLVYAQGTIPPASTEPAANKPGPPFIQIGTEGGFLPAPAMVNGPKQPILLMAPAERGDFIVDFRNVPVGSILILYNDAPAPFPVGDARNDYYPGNPKTPTAIAGSGPNTRTLLQFRVVAMNGAADPAITLPASNTAGIDPLLAVQTVGVPTPIPAGTFTRQLTLNETFDNYGRLIQYLGTNQPTNLGGPGQFGQEYIAPATEVIPRGRIEAWQIANLTGDTHPIHFHLVNVQILSRQGFNAKQYAGVPNYNGKPIAPDPNEMGWKETVRMNPGEVTTVLMKFDLPAVPFTVPVSPRTGGNEYVWHCHILEHEEHDMMRPIVVT